MFKIQAQKNSNNELRVTLTPVRNNTQSLRQKAQAFLGVPSEEVKSYSTVSIDSDSLLDIRGEFKTAPIKCSAHSHARTKFGRPAMTRIIRAAGALDAIDPEPTNYLFLTATLPSDEEWAKWAIAEDAHNLINGFKAWLSKRVQSRHEFYVWEHQNRGALHFHYCIHVPDRKIHDAIARDFRAQWMRLLDGMTERTGVCAWGKHANLSYEDKYAILQTRAETVYSSVSQYMASYCSNGKNKHSKDAHIPYYPKRWFGVSRGLSEAVRERTETDEQIFNSYGQAKTELEKLHELFSDESLTSRKFRHKVGVGETSVNYHTPKHALNLWESRKAMKYQYKTHPNIWSWIRTALTVHRTVSQLEKGSQLFRALSCKLPIESLRDGLFEGSLQRGSLHVTQVRSIETLWLDLSSRSTLPPSLSPLLTVLQRFIRIHSANYHQIRWNQHGWLITADDFECTVDMLSEKCECRTTATDEGTPSDPDSSRGHVPSEPKLEPLQLSLL